MIKEAYEAGVEAAYNEFVKSAAGAKWLREMGRRGMEKRIEQHTKKLVREGVEPRVAKKITKQRHIGVNKLHETRAGSLSQKRKDAFKEDLRKMRPEDSNVDYKDLTPTTRGLMRKNIRDFQKAFPRDK